MPKKESLLTPAISSVIEKMDVPVHFPFIYHWRATVHGVTGVRHDLATKQQQQQITAFGQPHPTLVKYKLKRNAQKENFALYDFP